MCWKLIAVFNLLKIRMRVDIFGTEKGKVTFGLKYIYFLTHISQASFLWDIGKQNSIRCDAAKTCPIWGYSVSLHNFHRKMK